ncbi:orf148 [Lactobacillus phage LP65]|uniref:Orf148 n=1 Tax=Lactobacillus phage LP65 TaxID=2892344 RepID=Q5ULG6_9CAUD|nr:hypothetical protein LP65_gp148 [Lactobacillus phage LP65]AAV35968.1 orf148 [Lactobacillus phage LP65]
MLKKFCEVHEAVAEQFDGSQEMCNNYWIIKNEVYNNDLGIHEGTEYFKTSLRGNIKIDIGDWLVVSEDIREVRVLSNYEFNERYTSADKLNFN